MRSPEGRVWFESRPPKIQALIREFPPGTVLNVEGERVYVVSYTEREDDGVGLSVTPINPSVDYEGSLDFRRHLCLDHLRDGSVTVHHLAQLLV